jgi:hypothetical protein
VCPICYGSAYRSIHTRGARTNLNRTIRLAFCPTSDSMTFDLDTMSKAELQARFPDFGLHSNWLSHNQPCSRLLMVQNLYLSKLS